MKILQLYVLALIVTTYLTNPSDARATNLANQANIPACDTQQCQFYFKEYKRRTREGYADAMETLASFYHVGYGTERNLDQALKWYKRAAKYFSVIGAYKTGLFYLTEPEYLDTESAIVYLKKAGRRKYANANYLLTLIYTQGEYITADYAQADHWLTYALESNHNRSIEYCQQLIANDIMTKSSFPNAYSLCSKATAKQPKYPKQQDKQELTQDVIASEAVLVEKEKTLVSNNFQAPENNGEMEIIEINPKSLPELMDLDLAYMKLYVAEKRRSQTGRSIYTRPCALTISCNEMSRDEFTRIRGFDGAGKLRFPSVGVKGIGPSN